MASVPKFFPKLLAGRQYDVGIRQIEFESCSLIVYVTFRKLFNVHAPYILICTVRIAISNPIFVNIK